MQITHEQARKLIQFSLDGDLQFTERARLSLHLQECIDCRNYASEIKEAESILLPLMKKHWNVRPIPLSMPFLLQSKNSISNTGKLLAIRSAALSLIFVAFFFSAWKFVSSSISPSESIPPVIPVVPTPFTQTAQSPNMTNTSDSCVTMVYSVQANDTLADIASRFLVPVDELMKINGLRTDALSRSMDLLIPLCNFTPTGTIHPATFTTTHTPIIRATTSTPEG